MNFYPRFQRGGFQQRQNPRPQSYSFNPRGNFRGRGNSNFPRQHAPNFARGRSRGGNQNANLLRQNTQRFNKVNQKPLIHQQFSYEEEDSGQFYSKESGYGKADIYYSSANRGSMSARQSSQGRKEQQWTDAIGSYDAGDESYGNYIPEPPDDLEDPIQQEEVELDDYEGESYNEDQYGEQFQQEDNYEEQFDSTVEGTYNTEDYTEQESVDANTYTADVTESATTDDDHKTLSAGTEKPTKSDGQDSDKKVDDGSKETNQEEEKDKEEEENEEEDSDSDEDTGFCKYCKMNFSSTKAYHAHTRGIQHTTLVMEAKAKKGNKHYQKEVVDPEVLKVTIPEPKPAVEEKITQLNDDNIIWISDDLDEETKQTIKDQVNLKPEERDLNPDDIGKKQFTDVYSCPLCDIRCTGAINFKMHVNGKQHKNNLEQAHKGGPIKKRKLPEENCVVVDVSERTAKLVKILEDVDQPIIGLEFITEFQKPNKASLARYVCNLCQSRCDEAAIVPHLIGVKHRLKYFQAKRPEIYDHLTKYSSKKKKTEINQSADELAQGVEKEVGRGEIKVKVEVGESQESVKLEMEATSQELKETVARLEKKFQNKDKSEDGPPEKRSRYHEDYDDYYARRPPRDYRREYPPPMEHYLDDYRRNPYGSAYRDRFAYRYMDPYYERMLIDERRRLDAMMERRYVLSDPTLERKRIDDIIARREYLERQEQRRVDDILERRRRLQEPGVDNERRRRLQESDVDYERRRRLQESDVDYERLKRFERARPAASTATATKSDERPSMEEMLARRRVIDYGNRPRVDTDRPRATVDTTSVDYGLGSTVESKPPLSPAPSQEHQRQAEKTLQEEAAKNPDINVADVLSKLKSSMVTSEDDAAMALEISNALSQALLQYRLQKGSQEVQGMNNSGNSMNQVQPEPSIPGIGAATSTTTSSHIPSFLRTSIGASETLPDYTSPPIAQNSYQSSNMGTYYPQSPVQASVPQTVLQLKSPVSQLTYSQAAKLPTVSHSSAEPKRTQPVSIQNPGGITVSPAKLLESIRHQTQLLKEKLASVSNSTK